MRISPEGDLIVRANEATLGLVLSASRMMPEALPFLESLNAQRLTNVALHKELGATLTAQDKDFLAQVEEVLPDALDHARDVASAFAESLPVSEDPLPTPSEETVRAWREAKRASYDIRLQMLEGQTDTPYIIEKQFVPFVFICAEVEAEQLEAAQARLKAAQKLGAIGLTDTNFLQGVEEGISERAANLMLEGPTLSDKDAVTMAENEVEEAELAFILAAYLLNSFPELLSYLDNTAEE